MFYFLLLFFFFFFFFFSSRRRHTRSLCDWSSDVCSSDLIFSSPPARAATPVADKQAPSFYRYKVGDRKSTRLNSSHTVISYAVFCLKKKKLQRWLGPACCHRCT